MNRAKKKSDVFYHLRQQEKKKEGVANFCLSDFVASKESEKVDYCGGFATTAGIGIEKWTKQFREEHNDYKAIMVEALADRLSEAFAELLHLEIRKNYWGYAPDENLSLDQILKIKYQGIRPALGYPACPEHAEKENLFKLIDAEKNLNFADGAFCHVSECIGFRAILWCIPSRVILVLKKLAKDQVEDYAKRKNESVEFVEKFLPTNLNYK